MKVTLDSNAWEKLFASEATFSKDLESVHSPLASLRSSMVEGRILGFIAEAAFGIEAIRKNVRTDYFAKPHTTTAGRLPPPSVNQNLVHLFSFGPDNSVHPGLPAEQVLKLKTAAVHCVRIIRGMNWFGLPIPPQLPELISYVPETSEERSRREGRQIMAFEAIRARGVGKAAFDRNGGWVHPPRELEGAKRFAKACAEWADGELVAAHIGYGNDVICTDDHARQAGVSIFNSVNRAWLAEAYGVQFMTIEELVQRVSE